MKILVTGGCGFVGTYLVEALLRGGHDVRVLDIKRDLLFPPQVNPGAVEILNGEIRDFEICLKACQGVEAVFHMAAIASIHESYLNPNATFEINVKGTENLLKASRDCGVKLFVFASSGKVYGNAIDLPSQETDSLSPTTPYGVSKHECEKICEYYSKVYSLKIISLRYFSVYGPRMQLSQGLIGDVFCKALKGDKVAFGGSKDMARDFTFIDDAIEASVLCLKYPCQGHEVFNVGSGKVNTVGELIRLIQKYIGKQIDVQYRDPPEGTIFKTYADISRAQKHLAYFPKTTLEEGLVKTFDWFKGASFS